MKSVKDIQLDADTGFMTSSDHQSTRGRRKRTRKDLVRYVCQLNKRLAYCFKDFVPEVTTTPDHVIHDVIAPAANKRIPAGGGVASIVDICSSETAGGLSQQSACISRYLKHFARRITTSGNKFVGR